MRYLGSSGRAIGVAVVAACVGVVFSLGVALAENWPQWRGPEGSGISREVGLPITWSETSGVVWKCDLPPWGASTPAIWANAIFVTTHTDDGRLLLLKIDKSTGRIDWTRQVGQGTADRQAPGKKAWPPRGRQKFHNTQNLASPSPVTDGDLVVVHFGNGDLAAYDFQGNRLWGRNLQDDHGRYTIWWGHANSPVLYQDLVISVCIQDSLSDMGVERAPSYLVAHDKRTGQMKWKTMRPTDAPAEAADSYTTPVFWNGRGRTEMIVMGGLILDAYDPASGRRLWDLAGLEGDRVITGPVVSGDTVYLTQGKRKDVLAVKLGGDGHRSTADILWRHGGPTPDSSTPVVSGGLVFLVTDDGIAKCLNAKTGEPAWQQRLKGNYRASPLAAEGRIYFLNMKGLATVIDAADHFHRLAENQLNDDTIASPVASDGKLFIRGHKTLYCLGK